jgi:2-methylisocitrate lyase-like PEP mutase family enzyme
LADPALRRAISSKEFIAAPGVFDLISALIANTMDFKALYVTGYGTVASYLGLPDAGIATYRDMVERIAQIVSRTDKPVIADADTGYGGLLNLHFATRGYEDAGVSAIQIEDQEYPKKCGHTPNRRVVSLEDMVKKIEVAVDSRRSDDLIVIARTDARTELGLDEAIRRGKAFAKAGADVVFIEAPESVDEMIRIAEEIDAPLVANMVNGGKTPLSSAARLREIGYAIAIYPSIGFLSTGAALQKAYADLLVNGETSSSIELYPFTEFHKLIGFEEVWAFEKKYAEV